MTRNFQDFSEKYRSSPGKHWFQMKVQYEIKQFLFHTCTCKGTLIGDAGNILPQPKNKNTIMDIYVLLLLIR